MKTYFASMLAIVALSGVALAADEDRTLNTPRKQVQDSGQPFLKEESKATRDANRAEDANREDTLRARSGISSGPSMPAERGGKASTSTSESSPSSR